MRRQTWRKRRIRKRFLVSSRLTFNVLLPPWFLVQEPGGRQMLVVLPGLQICLDVVACGLYRLTSLGRSFVKFGLNFKS